MADPNRFPLTRFTATNRSLNEALAIYKQRITDALDIYERHHMTFIDRPCPVCGDRRHSELESFHGAYHIALCCRCATPYVNPVPGSEALADYYGASPCNRMLHKVVRKRNERNQEPISDERVTRGLGLIAPHVGAGIVNVLEIGCGSGSFLSRFNRASTEKFGAGEVECVGVDIDANAIASCYDEDLTLVHAPVEDFAEKREGRFRLLFFFELIEHLADPFAFLQKALRLLAPGGHALFTTPNKDGLEMLVGYNSPRLLAHAVFPPMHLNAFGTSNIAHLVLRSGFDLCALETPGSLDVDIVTLSRDYLDEEGLIALADLDDGAKGLFQYLLARTNASSHMRLVVRKPKERP